MRPSLASLRLLLAASAGFVHLGCSQPAGSGSEGNGQSSGGSGGVRSGSSSSSGGLTRTSNAPASIGGASSSATGGTSTVSSGVSAGGSQLVSTGQRSEGGSSTERSESGGASTTAGRSSSAEQGGRTTRSTGGTGTTNNSGGTAASTTRPISFGTLLDAAAVIASAEQTAKSAATPNSSQWQASGDQHRTYRFAEANADEPYRLYVPTTWDKKAELPLVMFLHGSGSTEDKYVDQNNKQMISLAQQHGFVLVAPLGDQGAYGNFLRLSSPFGKPEEAAKLMAAVTADSERTNELSEKDVINVLELVLNEYPIDRSAVFLTGHSMGSGGTWYIGGKYATYWTGLAPMSGPFVQESGYPWDNLRPISLFVTEGTQAPSLEGSRALRDWLSKNGSNSAYKEVNADHGGMVRLVLPDVFDFFDRSRTK